MFSVVSKNSNFKKISENRNSETETLKSFLYETKLERKLSCFNIKKILMFPEMKPCTFNPKPTRKKFLIFLEMDLSSSNIKKFSYSLKRKLFLYFRKHNFFCLKIKKILIFPKTEPCNFQSKL